MEGACNVLTHFSGEKMDKCLQPERRTYEVAQGEVLVKVLASGINMSDVKEVRGLMPFVKTPIVTGRDFAGRVVEGPDELKGKLVFGTGGSLGFKRDGAHAHFLKVPANCVALKPEALSLEQAGTLGVPFLTAHQCVVDRCKVTAADTVVVNGAMGMVGNAALQLCKVRGAKTIALVRRHDDTAPLATALVQTAGKTEDKILEEILRVAGKPVDVFLDLVGNATYAIESLGNGGRLAYISALSPDAEMSFKVLPFYRKHLSIFGVNTIDISDEDCAAVLSDLAPLFDVKKLLPLPVNRTRFALTEAARAFEFVERQSSRKRVAILPWGVEGLSA